MLKRRKYTFILIFFIVALIAASFLPVYVPYSITTKALIKPIQTWELSRLPDGSLSSLLRNELLGSIQSYGVTEFRRGDVVNFKTNNELFLKGYLSAGDTVGFLYSNDEQMRLAELKGELEVIRAEIKFYQSGEKDSYIESVKREIDLAEETLRKTEVVFQRSKRLMRDTLISIEEFELDKHELESKKIALDLVKSRLNIATTGDKPERIMWLETRKMAVSDQIDQLRSRMEKLTFLSPISGKVILERNYISRDVLLKAIDTSKFIGIAPVLFRDLEYIEVGSEVSMRTQSNDKSFLGKIEDFNNVAEVLNGEIVVYVTFSINKNSGTLIPGKMIEVDITGRPLNPQQFTARLMRSPI